MEIEGTTFGTITIDGKTYEHDVIIRLSGEVLKRKKKLSKKYCGTSHVLSKDEAKFVFEKGCEQLIQRGARALGRPPHFLPVEIDIFGLLARKSADAQKKPAER